MLRDDEISSTEKLLTLIRKNNIASEDSMISQGRQLISRNIVTDQKQLCVGIDFNGNAISMSKIWKSHNKWEIIDFRRIENIDINNYEENHFSQILKSILTDFEIDIKKTNIWSYISSDKCDVRHILIPKVSNKLLSNTIYWTAKREHDFNENQTFFDYEVLGDVIDNGIGKTQVMIYTAPKHEINNVKNLFQKSGFLLDGITLQPFAIQNLLRNNLLKSHEETIATLYIGYEYSQINIFKRNNLVLTRRIKACANGMAENFIDSFRNDLNNVDINELLPLNRVIELLFKFEEDEATKKITLMEKENGIDPKYFFERIKPAILRLTRQIERTFQYYESVNKDDQINICYLYGEIKNIKNIVNFIKKHIDIELKILNIFTPDFKSLGNIKKPESLLEKSIYTSNIGLALSNDHQTPNFLFNYKDRERQESQSKIYKFVRIAFLFLFIICICIFVIQLKTLKQKNEKVIELKNILASYGPELDAQKIEDEIKRIKDLKDKKKRFAKKYIGLAVISELIKCTPYFIRFENIHIDLGNVKSYKKYAKIKLNGLVLQEKNKPKDTYEASLASYVLTLEKSLLFNSPSVYSKELKYLDKYGGKALTFELTLNIVSTVSN